MTKKISLVVSKYLELREMDSIDEDEEDADINFSKKVMILSQNQIKEVYQRYSIYNHLIH